MDIPGEVTGTADDSGRVAEFIPPAVEQVTVSGQIVHKRNVSKRLLFVDIKKLPLADDSEPVYWEIVAKFPVLSVEEVSRLRSAVKLGDVITVRGWPESAGSLLLDVLTMDVPWSTVSKGRAFVAQRPHNNTRICDVGPATVESATAVTATTTTWGSVGSAGAIVMGVCKFWLNSNCCPHGASCRYQHGDTLSHERQSQLRKQYVKARGDCKRRALVSDDPCDPHEKLGHNERAMVFVQWLLKTYGAEYLNSGSGVLDIAGGRGDVSFELFTKNGIKCTLIEPREMKLTKQQSRLMGKANTALALCPHMRTMFNNDFIADPANAQLLSECSLVVGMHPDQATGHIVNFALARNKPFAVIPCCVFPGEFPTRQLLHGGEVNTYETLVQFLCEQHGSIQKTFLPFVGRNQVVYSTAVVFRAVAAAADV
eukprot:TRINITY_DN11029_c0_g1_i2.p1 TRINITY_DN11029_c0_g1~~TRINITY_DN11029_c0_g1_i2.p1  ORF type:complete len:426 (-),score=95.54 TRINITY_DN11029_c0_g1_i2:395-1672(-)